MPQSSFETLSKEVDQLGHLIGDVIREMAGDDGFESVSYTHLTLPTKA